MDTDGNTLSFHYILLATPLCLPHLLLLNNENSKYLVSTPIFTSMCKFAPGYLCSSLRDFNFRNCQHRCSDLILAAGY